MNTVLNEFKNRKKAIFVCLFCLFAILFICTTARNISDYADAKSRYEETVRVLPTYEDRMNVDTALSNLIVNLLKNVCRAAVFALGLFGLLSGKDAFSKVAFVLLLCGGFYAQIVAASTVIGQFPIFRMLRDDLIGYYLVSLASAIDALVFAALAVLNWILDQKPLQLLTLIFGFIWIGSTAVKTVWAIVLTVHGVDYWLFIVESLYVAAFAVFAVAFALTGRSGYEETASVENPRVETPAD